MTGVIAGVSRVTEPDADAIPLADVAAATGDSITVAAWTALSRATGVARVAAIGAVLGPTALGNTFQFTNSLPNLVYYGFLAGSLFSSLLVPALVHHVDRDDRFASERLAGGFFGVTLLALVALTPLAVLMGPLLLRLGSISGVSAHVSQAQERAGLWLVVMLIPQIFLYAVIATSTAIMNARYRFALAAAAPALENIGTVVVLVVAALLFHGRATVETVGTPELLVLGLGATGAVGIHAAVQWWGARRAGVTLIPRAGWRDREVVALIRRTLPALAQAGLYALQILAMLAIANRVVGGVVAFQIALNFYSLPIALAATPVAVALIPRLARLHLLAQSALFRDTLLRGFTLALFLTVPAVVGYLTLAFPLARAIAFGRLAAGQGVRLIALSLASLCVGAIGQTGFLIGTNASYARKDTRSPLESMILQAVTCLLLMSLAFLARGATVLVIIGLAYSASQLLSACHLNIRIARSLATSKERLGPSLARIGIAAALMAGPAWITAARVPHFVGGAVGPRLAILAAALVGVVVFVSVQVVTGGREVAWASLAVRRLRGRALGDEWEIT